MKLSQDLQISLSVAMTEAQRLGHEYTGLDHLLYALTFDAKTATVMRHAGANVERLQKRLASYLADEVESVRFDDDEEEDFEPRLTLGLQRALSRAAAQVESAGKPEVQGPDLLVAMFAEADSYGMELLAADGVTRLDVVSFIAHGISKLQSSVRALPSGRPDSSTSEDRAPAGDDEDERGFGAVPGGDALASFTQELTEMARKGAIDPLIGRDNEVRRTLHILQRRRKNNPIYVGDPGVG
ncbi:MAG TPA: Clp protease N-terminal domain-containing protein, partial [Thermoanaerobaculia bacterium]|nr:Clp protease N-terminal domain-containing protein [Thermoanaerobaculia bacterium]